jgi:ligand-binding SRPBCC domain-containing protein
MPTIVIDTPIRAPIERVFDLARDVGAHVESSAFTGERAVEPGKTSGLLEAGDLLTFEGRHLGVRQRLTVRITEMQPPVRFVDEGVRTIFRALRHVHEFLDQGDGIVVMRDTVQWRSPFGAIGS